MIFVSFFIVATMLQVLQFTILVNLTVSSGPTGKYLTCDFYLRPFYSSVVAFFVYKVS